MLASCCMLVYCLAGSSTLNMDAICSSETAVDFAGIHKLISHKAQKTELVIVPLDLALDGSVMRDVTVEIKTDFIICSPRQVYNS